MSFVLLDDKFWTHPKTLAAGNEAIGVLVRSWSWSADLGTGGHVPYDMLTFFAGSPQKAASLRSRLETGRLLDRCQVHDRCASIHDWSDRNEDAEEAAERRRFEADKKRKQRARRRATLRGEPAGQGILSPGDTEGDIWGDGPGDTGGDTPGGQGGHVPGDIGGQSHARMRSQSQSQSPNGSQLVDPPQLRNARVVTPEDTLPSVAAARRRACATDEPDLDGWDLATVRRVCTAAVERYRNVNREEAFERLLVLAALSDTRSAGRLLEPSGWDLAGREVARMSTDRGRRAIEDQAQVDRRRHDQEVSAEQEKRRTKVASLLDSDPDGWQAATTAATDALTAAGITPLGPLIEARALALYQPQETSR